MYVFKLWEEARVPEGGTHADTGRKMLHAERPLSGHKVSNVSQRLPEIRAFLGLFLL